MLSRSLVVSSAASSTSSDDTSRSSLFLFWGDVDGGRRGLLSILSLKNGSYDSCDSGGIGMENNMIIMTGFNPTLATKGRMNSIPHSKAHCSNVNWFDIYMTVAYK